MKILNIYVDDLLSLAEDSSQDLPMAREEVRKIANNVYWDLLLHLMENNTEQIAYLATTPGSRGLIASLQSQIAMHLPHIALSADSCIDAPGRPDQQIQWDMHKLRTFMESDVDVLIVCGSFWHMRDSNADYVFASYADIVSEKKEETATITTFQMNHPVVK